MKKSIVYFGLGLLFCLAFPFSAFAKEPSSQTGQVFQVVGLPNVHTTKILNAHYIVPPKNFNPLNATDAQLKKYGFPERPKSKKKLKAWKNAMGHAKHFVKPVFTVHPMLSSTTYNDTSSNWSGYEVRDPTYSMDNMVAEWYVPSVSRSNRTSYSVTWIGFDGASYGRNHLIQAGTAQNHISGRNEYYFWWEQITDTHDTHIVQVDYPSVSSSDEVEVYIDYNPSSSETHYYLYNFTTGVYTNFYKSSIMSGQDAYYGYTAEWIEERQTRSGSLPDLANFDAVSFLNASAISRNNSNDGSIGNWSNIRKIKMYNGGTLLAYPGSLSGGDSFIDYWNNYN